jgi:signal transduction histidine kinase
VAFLGIFYTHKIAGPFVRVKQFARSAERDKYMEKLSFRDKDAIKPLAQEINATIEAYREKLSSFSGELKELEDILNVAGKISGDGMDRAIMDDIIRVHESLKEEAARLKL